VFLRVARLQERNGDAGTDWSVFQGNFGPGAFRSWLLGRLRRSAFRRHIPKADFGPLTPQSSTVVAHHEREIWMARRKLTVNTGLRQRLSRPSLHHQHHQRLIPRKVQPRQFLLSCISPSVYRSRTSHRFHRQSISRLPHPPHRQHRHIRSKNLLFARTVRPSSFAVSRNAAPTSRSLIAPYPATMTCISAAGPALTITRQLFGLPSALSTDGNRLRVPGFRSCKPAKHLRFPDSYVAKENEKRKAASS
jgi:hypothetical protein